MLEQIRPKKLFLNSAKFTCDYLKKKMVIWLTDMGRSLEKQPVKVVDKHI